MAKRIINIGSSANHGDGDPLRNAFVKINENFTELYSGPPTYTQVEIDTIIPTVGMMVYNITTGKFQGYAGNNGDSTVGWVDFH